MISICKILSLLPILLLASCSSDKVTEENSLEKALSTSREDLEYAYLKGQNDAMHDISNGILSIKRIGMPPIEKYVNELKDKYNINVITVSGYFVSMMEQKNIEGYNSYSLNEIKKIYGNEPFEIIKYISGNIPQIISGSED
jgi:ribosomal protein S17E